MERYKLVNNPKINNILLYIIIFATIIFSRDTLVTSIKLGFYKSFFIYVVIILISICLIFINTIKQRTLELIKIRKEPIISIGIFVGLIIFTSIIKWDFQMYIISIIFYIFVAYLFIMIFTFEDFFRKFSNIMVFLSIISLVMCYVIRGTLLFPSGVVNSNIPILTNSAGLKFFDLGLSYVVAAPYYIRNFGVFREPGVYQFFLLLPFIYELLIEKRKIRVFNVVILFVTLLSTFSLAGIIIMALVILGYIIKIILEKKVTKMLIITLISFAIMGIITIILLYINNPNFNSIVNESFKKLTTVNESSSARFGSIITNSKLFLNSPIWGNDFAVVQYASFDNTNSTISIFAIFGFFVGILHIGYLYILSGRVSSMKVIRVLIMIIFLLLINSQFLIGNTIFWIYMFSAYMIKEDYSDEEEAFSLKDILNKIILIKNKIFDKSSDEI